MNRPKINSPLEWGATFLSLRASDKKVLELSCEIAALLIVANNQLLHGLTKAS